MPSRACRALTEGMHVTKHEHACLRLEREGKTLIIDPGTFTSPLEDLHDAVAVVVTHEHPDHWTSQHLSSILEQFPNIPVYGPEGVVRAAAGFDIREVSPGDKLEAGPFSLEFFGGRHAVIHESIPVIDNVGVLVDDEFYYPGDSYAVPKGAHVKLLAAPVGAPWLKIGDAMDFVLEVKPQRVFATHDMTLSAAGLSMGRERLTWAAQQNGGDFVALDPGDSTDL